MNAQGTKPKLLLVYVDPGTLREVAAAAQGFELVPLRDRARLDAALAANPTTVAVLAEHDERAPAGASALDLLTRVRATRPALRRLLVSAFADLGMIVDGLHSGILDGIVYRPVEAFELRAALRIPQPAAPRAAERARRVVPAAAGHRPE